MATQYEKAEALQKLHASNETFVIPNPWDIGSARMFEGLGFKALATTSSGFAYTLGRVDGQVTLEEKLAHCRLLAAATSIPINADLENCFADDPAEAARTITLAAEAGIVAGSIEDYSGSQIYDFDHAVERVHAAIEAAQALDFPFTVVARAENLLRGVNDLDDTIRRLQAFETAGADMLYAPGLKTLEQVRTVVGALSKPVNVLITTMSEPNVTVADLAAAGVRRISIGGAMAKVAYGSLLKGGQEMLELGSFAWLTQLSTAKGLDQLLS